MKPFAKRLYGCRPISGNNRRGCGFGAQVFEIGSRGTKDVQTQIEERAQQLALQIVAKERAEQQRDKEERFAIELAASKKKAAKRKAFLRKQAKANA